MTRDANIRIAGDDFLLVAEVVIQVSGADLAQASAMWLVLTSAVPLLLNWRRAVSRILSRVPMSAPVDMSIAWKYVLHMKMIQIRNVPDELHRRLKARAALEGTSLSEYLRAQIQAVAERPTIAELRQRLGSRSRVRSRESAAAAVRAERDTR